MSEWSELTWDDAMQRGYEALSQGEMLYEETAEEGRRCPMARHSTTRSMLSRAGPTSTSRSTCGALS
jgi:hypothetical protein